MAVKICILFLSLLPILAVAQNNAIITGVIADSSGNVLPAADIRLQKTNDSVSAANTVADANGFFKFDEQRLGAYELHVTYLDLQPTSRRFTITDSALHFNVDTVKLYNSYNEMQDIIVYSTPPIVVKGDTTEYNISNLGVNPYATAGDALKKLAEVEVDNSGTIKVRGETVKRVYVNGKRFFGDDPKMATQNLPADMIEKIQIFDAKSDQAEFTGFNDGDESQTINIVTKSEYKDGSFGKFSAGVGSDFSVNKFSNKLYATGGNYNRFKGDEQLSIVGQLNNNNEQMFTMPGDINMQRGAGSNKSGLTKTMAIGANYRNKFNKTEISSSYLYNNTDHQVEQDRFTQNFLKNDTLQNTLSKNQSRRKRINHSFNFNAETKFDSLKSLILRPTFNYQETENRSSSQNNIYRYFANDTTKISNTDQHNNNRNHGLNGGIDLTYRQRFKKRGRTISANSVLRGAENKGESYNYNDIYAFRTLRHTITNQFFTNSSQQKTAAITLAYTEPLTKNQTLEFNLNYSYNDNSAHRKTYNFDSAVMDYTLLDSLLTNKFTNTFRSQRATLSYQYKNQKITFSASAGLQTGEMNSINETKNYTIARKYHNFYPTVHFNYRFPNAKNIRFTYTGRTEQPSVSQLQPVPDNSNRLYIVDGNPELNQLFNHRFRISYGSFRRRNSKNMFLRMNANFTQNAIINSITTLSNGGQYIKPINKSGPYDINAFFNYGFALRKPKSNLNLSTHFAHNRSVSLVDSVVNNTYTTSVGEQIRWNTNLKETFDINFSTRPTIYFANYTINKNQQGNYYSQSIAIDGTWFTKSGWISHISFDYTFYTGLEQGFNLSIPLLQVDFSKQLFKNKAGEIKLSVSDLLNQNKAIVNTRTENYIRQNKSNLLQRYGMLSFIYHLKGSGSARTPRQRFPRF